MKKATTTTKASTSGSNGGNEGDNPSQLIDAKIKELRDWRGETWRGCEPSSGRLRRT